MTTRTADGVVIIMAESDGVCELCGAIEETRPYGPGGRHVCFDCGMKDEPEAKRRFCALLDGVDLDEQPS